MCSQTFSNSEKKQFLSSIVPDNLIVLSFKFKQINNEPAITEHDLSATEKVIVLINYSPEGREVALTFAKDWTVEKIIYGKSPVKSSVSLKANDSCVLLLKR